LHFFVFLIYYLPFCHFFNITFFVVKELFRGYNADPPTLFPPSPIFTSTFPLTFHPSFIFPFSLPGGPLQNSLLWVSTLFGPVSFHYKPLFTSSLFPYWIFLLLPLVLTPSLPFVGGPPFVSSKLKGLIEFVFFLWTTPPPLAAAPRALISGSYLFLTLLALSFPLHFSQESLFFFSRILFFLSVLRVFLKRR